MEANQINSGMFWAALFIGLILYYLLNCSSDYKVNAKPDKEGGKNGKSR